jgi:hypothetical protein
VRVCVRARACVVDVLYAAATTVGGGGSGGGGVGGGGEQRWWHRRRPTCGARSAWTVGLLPWPILFLFVL